MLSCMQKKSEARLKLPPEKHVDHLHAEEGEYQVQHSPEHLHAEKDRDKVQHNTEHTGDHLHEEEGEDQVKLNP